jgi:fructan beta-fructosidase
VSEIDKIAENWQNAGTELDVKDAYQLRITLQLDKNASIVLSNSSDEKYVLDLSASARTLTAHRTSTSGMTSFNGTFSVPSMQAPLCVTGSTVTLDIFVDQSSVEVFTQTGSMSMTNLVFPKSLYNRLSITGTTVEAQVRRLKRIWN